MGDTQRQRQAFEFLRDHFHSQEPFTREEFQAAIPDWAPNKAIFSPASAGRWRETLDNVARCKA